MALDTLWKDILLDILGWMFNQKKEKRASKIVEDFTQLLQGTEK